MLPATFPACVSGSGVSTSDSFHQDPRTMIEEMMRAQRECMTSWEMEEANRAWDERREPRFYPPPPGGPGSGGSAR